MVARARIAPHTGVPNGQPNPAVRQPISCEWSLGWYIPSTEAARSGWAATIDTTLGWIRPCASLAPRCKSVLVARSLDQFTRHTETVNLYAPLTLPVGHSLAIHVGCRILDPGHSIQQQGRNHLTGHTSFNTFCHQSTARSPHLAQPNKDRRRCAPLGKIA